MPNEKITNGQVDKSPKHIQGRGRKPFATRFGKWALKGTPHHAADKMRNGVGEKEAAEEVRCIVNPLHRQALLILRACVVEEINDLPGRAGFTHPRVNPRDTVDV